jgi:hypothetical protein
MGTQSSSFIVKNKTLRTLHREKKEDLLRSECSRLLVTRYGLLGPDYMETTMCINEDSYSRDPQIIVNHFACVATNYILSLNLWVNITAVHCNNSCLRESAIRHLYSIKLLVLFSSCAGVFLELLGDQHMKT